MDGYQAARAIRGSGKKDAEMIPIIAITANAFVEDKRKTMEAGMDAHLSKPLNVPELMETIRNSVLVSRYVSDRKENNRG